MTGELIINGKDAFTNWGISLEPTTGISALMAPVPQKTAIENKSRAKNGKEVIPTTLQDERDITIPIHLCAKNKTDFLSKYGGFCAELATGVVNITTSHNPGVMYRCTYISCNNYSQFRFGIAKYSLRLNEPNPANRAVS